tara:strand:+ start:1268 stop:1525 length:258 start_codon:yes stop_codon:yes gene_type:complete
MLATSSNEIVVLTTKNKSPITLGLDEYTKWLCLIEAMEYIEQKALEIKVNLDNTDSWIKPLALQKYVKERFVSMRHDVSCNLKGQ